MVEPFVVGADPLLLAARTTSPQRVVVTGEVDMATAAQLRAYLLAVISGRQDDHEIEVDLAEVTFLDACGIGALMGARMAALAAGRGLGVRNPRGVVRRMLDVAGVAWLLLPAGDLPTTDR